MSEIHLGESISTGDPEPANREVVDIYGHVYMKIGSHWRQLMPTRYTFDELIHYRRPLWLGDEVR